MLVFVNQDIYFLTQKHNGFLNVIWISLGLFEYYVSVCSKSAGVLNEQIMASLTKSSQRTCSINGKTYLSICIQILTDYITNGHWPILDWSNSE